MKTIKFTPGELKVAVRALSELEDSMRRKALDAGNDGKTGAATRYWNDVEMISKALQKLGHGDYDTKSAARMSQIELEAAASDAHLAAFGSLNQYNLPEQSGSHRDLTRIRKMNLESKIVPSGILGGWQPGETTGVGIGRIKTSPTEAPLLFCHAIEIDEQCNIVRQSEWLSFSQTARAHDIIAKWENRSV